jgi:predicted RNA binding protein YcfA (HicA-like mRNA interferase family)
MSRSPRVTGDEVIVALGRAGFKVIRIRGSHFSWGMRTGGAQLYRFTPAKRSGLDYSTRSCVIAVSALKMS